MVQVIKCMYNCDTTKLHTRLRELSTTPNWRLSAHGWNTPITSTEKMWSSKKQLNSLPGTSGRVLDKATNSSRPHQHQVFTEFEFHQRNIAGHVQKQTRPNCCSLLFSEATCGFRRLDAVNYAFKFKSRKKHLSTAASRLVPTRIHTFVHASGFSG